MAGHNKWTNTKYRKATQDAKRGKIFTKLIHELVTAARLGGCNPSINPRLRSAINKALSNNMTRSTLNRAIARGIGDDPYNNMESFIYGGYGPGGTAFVVECLSDNRNRTVAEIRHAFNKNGGSFSTDGAVTYLFKKVGLISLKREDENLALEKALAAGVTDVVTCDDGTINIYTAWEKIDIIHHKLKVDGLKINNTAIVMMPLNKVYINSETEIKLIHLIKMLENCSDVQKIYHNGETLNDNVMTIT